ncbi:interferon alpha-4-like [Conger conger]|uniref:interferon alpha-4-like n=1 Tax=Conger conger TaxID=82655 RepID=UPI002A5AA7EE|nr:interferon alpha-4-like [Conger conger]
MTPENSAWLCALLCVSQVLSAPINCRLDGTRIQTCHNLLKDMGGTFPGECINENVLITFPGSAFASNGTAEQNDSVRTAVYQTLHSINSLFENHDLPTEWDESKLNNFQNIINGLVEKNKCVGRSKPESDGSDHTDVSARTATLRNYFERLAAVLQEKNSFCAWEVVRKELVRTLLFILEKKSDSLLWPKRT